MNLLAALDDEALFGPHFPGASWAPWKAFLATMFGLPATDSQISLAHACTGRTDALSGPFREAWLVIGRRSGKSRILALIAVFLACFMSWRNRLSPGEVGVIMVLAADRDQAGVILGYIKGLLTGTPLLAQLVTAEHAERVELGSLGVAIEIHTNNYRSPRGRTVIAALCDEVAFWRSDTSANPGEATVAALRPSLLTLAPHSLLIGASSPYSRSGLLWDQYRKHHGVERSPVLVWQAASRTMNPSLPAELIADALAADPEAGGAEYLAEFRRDIAAFVSAEVIASAVVPGRHELPCCTNTNYVSFIDPSGGSSDSFTMAIAHREGDCGVLDCVREYKPPFSPEEVCCQLADVLKTYTLARVTSDKYAGIWPVAEFGKHGITVNQCADPKNLLYSNLLPALNSGRVELLDNLRLLTQLAGLERRTARSGRDSVDHGPGGHDDVVNSAAGALTLALAKQPGKIDLKEIIYGHRSAVEMMFLRSEPANMDWDLSPGGDHRWKGPSYD